MTDAARAAESFKDILEKNQQFISNLQSIHDNMAAQLAEKEAELRDTQSRLEQAQKELNDLQEAQLQWAVDRHGLMDQQAALQKDHEMLTGRVGQFEQERSELARKYEAEQKKLRDQLTAVMADLDTLQAAQLQWAVDREHLLQDRDAAVAKLAQLEHEWQAARAQLTRDKANLVAKVAETERQLQVAKAELEPLRASRDKWQSERQHLLTEVTTLEQEAHAREGRHKADLKVLQSELERARRQLEELEKLREERRQLSEERTALLAKVRAMEHDWQARETSVAEERTTWKEQLQAANARYLAMQQDYEKLKGLHADLAGESGKRAEEWTAREQRLTAEKNQLKVDLERVQVELSDMLSKSNELQGRRKAEQKDLEKAWEQEKAALKAQLEDARKASGGGTSQSQLIARHETEKRALQAQLDGLRSELAASGKSKSAAPALAQARRDFEAKFRVIYDQSHELNSPLNAIIGFSEILLDEPTNKTTPEERREFMQHIHDSGKRLLEHIRELIEFSKQEAGIQERPAELLPPASHSSSKPPTILVADNDPAVKERVEPFLSHAGYDVVFAASSQEALKKAVQLQPLAILIDTQLPPSGGSGLLYDLKRESKTRNLPVVLTSKGNKEQLGFDIGQCDFLTKPIDRQQLLQMMVKFDLLADGKRGKKTPATVLLIDDDPQNIRLVKAMLKPYNMEILVADGGKSGIEQALKKKPDLIILDLMMPDVDGFEVVSALRKDPAGSQIPILIYTAKNISSEDREHLQGNIQSIIQKGDFGKDRFLEMINNLQTAQAS